MKEILVRTEVHFEIGNDRSKMGFQKGRNFWKW